MAASTITNVPLILKELWVDEIHDFQYKDQPFYGMVPKDTSWSGLKLHVTVQYANGTSVSSKFEKAKAGKRVSTYAAMEVETADLFALWAVDNKLITLTRDQKGSLVRALSEATEKANKKFKRRTAWQLWGNGGGAAAKISGISTTVATLSNAQDVRNFDIGDICEFAGDDGRANGGVLDGTRTITAIDEDLGKLTFDTTLATIATLGANDFIFHEGDYNNVIKGVEAYVTTQDPGVGDVPTSIWGMTRTAFMTRLSGHRMTPSANLIAVEAVKEALMKAFVRSCGVTDLYCRPQIFNEIEMSLEGQRRYADEKVGKVGFSGLIFTSQSGKEVKLFADPDIKLGPSGEELIFGLNRDSWKFHTAEEWPMWLTADGEKKFMTEENANAREGRLGGYGNLYCKAPGENFVLLLS